jgi:hypothetical protein
MTAENQIAVKPRTPRRPDLKKKVIKYLQQNFESRLESYLKDKNLKMQNENRKDAIEALLLDFVFESMREGVLTIEDVHQSRFLQKLLRPRPQVHHHEFDKDTAPFLTIVTQMPPVPRGDKRNKNE